MRDKLTEIIKSSLVKHIDKSCKLAENITDDLLTEGVIVPPLSIGQKVYINAFGNDIQSFTVTNIYVQRDRDNRTYFAYDAEIGEGNDIYFHEEKIGNFIFLNLEEAEKALAERREV